VIIRFEKIMVKKGSKKNDRKNKRAENPKGWKIDLIHLKKMYEHDGRNRYIEL
jgi:hypothetical protein